MKNEMNDGWNVFYLLGIIILVISIMGMINEHTAKRLNEIPDIIESKNVKSPEEVLTFNYIPHIGHPKMFEYKGVECIVFVYGEGTGLSCNWEKYNSYKGE